MLCTIGIRHSPFLCTDYSLPVSSCPPKGLFFLSCNDVITLDFCLLKHNSIIVKSEKLLARKSCLVQNKQPPHFLSISKRDFNSFRAFLFSSSLYALSFTYGLDALNSVCWGKFHGKGLKSKTFHQTYVIILSSVVVRRGCVKAECVGFESSLARTLPIFFFCCCFLLFAYLFGLFLKIYIYFLFPIGFSPLTFYFWSFTCASRGSVMHVLVGISS